MSWFWATELRLSILVFGKDCLEAANGSIPYFAFRISHSAFRTPHSAFRIPLLGT
jgi:hypothetical protein